MSRRLGDEDLRGICSRHWGDFKRQKLPGHMNPYDNVFVHLLSWESANEGEIEALNMVGNILQREFNYDVIPFTIPTINPGVYFKEYFRHHHDLLGDRTTLSIVYYAGHSGFNSGGFQLSARSEGYGDMYWTDLLSAFEDMRGDVLFILDSCLAASATIQDNPRVTGKRQLLAASGLAEITYPHDLVPFTPVLMETFLQYKTENRPGAWNAKQLQEDVFRQLGLRWQTFQMFAPTIRGPSTPVFATLDGAEDREPIQPHVMLGIPGRRLQLDVPFRAHNPVHRERINFWPFISLANNL